MKNRKQKNTAKPAANEDKAAAAGQTAERPQPAAESAAPPASAEETPTSAIDLDAEFSRRAGELKKEANRIEEERKKLKLDQDELDVAQHACRDEKERLKKWEAELLEKEKSLATREAAVAAAEKTVEDDFREKRRKFSIEMTKEKEGALERLEKDEKTWQEGYEKRRSQQIEDLEKELARQRDEFLEWKKAQESAFSEREKEIIANETEYAELSIKCRNLDVLQKRVERREKNLQTDIDTNTERAVTLVKSDYKREIDLLQERITALTKERKELQEELDKLRRLLDRTGEDPKKFLSELNAAISTYDKQLEEGLAQADRMPDIIADKDNEIKTLKEQYKELSKEYADLLGQQSKEAKLKADVTYLEGRLEDTERILADWEAERKRRSQIAARDAGSHIKNILDPDPDLVRTVDARGREILPQDSELVWLEHIYKKMQDYNTPFPRRILYAFHTALKNAEFSPLTVLAGVSGTGKSLLPDLYAAFGGINFISVPVQPNWDCPESLLGFFNSLSGNFEATPLLKFLAQTQLWNKDFLPDGEDPEMASDYGLRDAMSIVLLDEMNLAHIELYFADFLSKLEERRGKTADIPRLKIKITDTQDYPLPMERNVLWLGTMNQDETTKSLSDKVLDRSAIIDFPRPITFNRRKKLLPREGVFAPAPLINCNTWMQWNSIQLTDDPPPPFTPEDDRVIEKYKKIVEDINAQMENAGRALGHRVWQSIEMYMANHPLVRFYSEQKGQAWENALGIAFEDQLIQKIMPKLRGVDTAVPGLEKIRQILHDNGISPALCEDYERATSDLNDGQFIWSSSHYFAADNDLGPVDGIDAAKHQSRAKTIVRKTATPPEPPVAAEQPTAEPAAEAASGKPDNPPATPPETTAAEPATEAKAPAAAAASPDAGATANPKQSFRSFIEALNAGFTPEETDKIITTFDTEDKLRKKWDGVKNLRSKMLLPLSRTDVKLAKKLIEALETAGL